jgi:hypothetical protein
MSYNSSKSKHVLQTYHCTFREEEMQNTDTKKEFCLLLLAQLKMKMDCAAAGSEIQDDGTDKLTPTLLIGHLSALGEPQ